LVRRSTRPLVAADCRAGEAQALAEPHGNAPGRGIAHVRRQLAELAQLGLPQGQGNATAGFNQLLAQGQARRRAVVRAELAVGRNSPPSSASRSSHRRWLATLPVSGR